jgi:hypothetical protein
MPSEMGFCQFFHGFQPTFHGQTNDFAHAPGDDSAEQKLSWILGRPRPEPCANNSKPKSNSGSNCVPPTPRLATPPSVTSNAPVVLPAIRIPTRCTDFLSRDFRGTHRTWRRILRILPRGHNTFEKPPEVGRLLPTRERGVAHLEPLGSGCRIREGEQRHDDYYHAFTPRAQPRDALARCGQLL